MNEKFGKLITFLKNREENKDHIRWMAQQAKPYRRTIFLMMVFEILSLLLSLLSTFVSKTVVDRATTARLDAKYVAIMAGSALLSIAFAAGFRIFNEYVNENFSFGLRCNMFSGIQSSVWQKLIKFHSGDVVTRLTSDVGGVASGIMTIVPNTVVTALQLIIAFFILFHYDHQLSIFALVIGPLGGLISLTLMPKFKVYQTRLRESESKYRAFMQESVSNITVVKTFRMEEENDRTMQQLRADRLKTTLSAAYLGAGIHSLMRVFYNLGYIIAFCWGAYRISTGDITYGTLTLFISLVTQVQGSLSRLSRVLPQFYSMVICSKRIREVTDIENEQFSGRDDMPERVGIKMEHVQFAYDVKPVLNDVTIEIKPGERVGIVGASGAGKTTLIRLLLALITPQSGTQTYITEAGTQPVEPDSRRFISYVPQGNTLLSGTIEQNLRNGNMDATEEDLWTVLKAADADGFVKNLPDGLDTVLSEHAGGISEGQAQRLSIARALLKNHPLLILDEATSALDEQTEAKVLDGISQYSDRTCMFITHRRSMLRYCDKVLELSEDGYVTMRTLDHANDE